MTLTRVEAFCKKRDSRRVESPSFSTWLESSQSHQKSWLESSRVESLTPVTLTLLFTHCSCSCGNLWRQSIELWYGSENIIRANNKFFTKNAEYLRSKYLGGPRQVPRLTSPKPTTVYNPDNDLIWEYETGWTPVCVLSHLMCTCKHCRPVVPKLWYAYQQWYAKAFSVVHE